MKRLLVAFDFDHTIVDVNSDIEIRRLVNSSKIPERVKNLYKSTGWTNYMREIFLILHRNNITKEKIVSECHRFKATEGMVDLIKTLKNKLEADIIVISDSNSLFIEEWLLSANLDKFISRVFTNPAYFNSDGLLNIEMYHEQTWCNLSTKNLCKGSILDEYINTVNDKFDIVAYVGDGNNDLCPSLRLKETDVLFPRIGYQLNKVISEGNQVIKAQIHPWNSGHEILNVLEQMLQ